MNMCIRAVTVACGVAEDQWIKVWIRHGRQAYVARHLHHTTHTTHKPKRDYITPKRKNFDC